jgi:hypothetical protein
MIKSQNQQKILAASHDSMTFSKLQNKRCVTAANRRHKLSSQNKQEKPNPLPKIEEKIPHGNLPKFAPQKPAQAPNFCFIFCWCVKILKSLNFGLLLIIFCLPFSHFLPHHRQISFSSRDERSSLNFCDTLHLHPTAVLPTTGHQRALSQRNIRQRYRWFNANRIWRNRQRWLDHRIIWYRPHSVNGYRARFGGERKRASRWFVGLDSEPRGQAAAAGN